MKWRLILLFIAGAVAVPAIGATHSQTVTVVIHAINGSNETGTATIAKVPGGKLLVTIALRNEPGGVKQNAHIHPGTCAKVNPVPQTALNSVVNGKSETTVTAWKSSGPLAIVVHNGSMTGYVACGEIPAL